MTLKGKTMWEATLVVTLTAREDPSVIPSPEVLVLGIQLRFMTEAPPREERSVARQRGRSDEVGDPGRPEEGTGRPGDNVEIERPRT